MLLALLALNVIQTVLLQLKIIPCNQARHSTNGVDIDLRKTLCEHVNGLCPAGWLNEQSGSSPYVLVPIVGPLAETLPQLFTVAFIKIGRIKPLYEVVEKPLVSKRKANIVPIELQTNFRSICDL